MKNGRINERNIGHWSLSGEPKVRGKKVKPLPELTEDQEKALTAVDTIDAILTSHKSGYYSYLLYDMENPLIAHWVKNGYVTKGLKESDYPDLFEPKEICLLNQSKISDLELVRGLLISVHKLEPYIDEK